MRKSEGGNGRILYKQWPEWRGTKSSSKFNWSHHLPHALVIGQVMCDVCSIESNHSLEDEVSKRNKESFHPFPSSKVHFPISVLLHPHRFPLSFFIFHSLVTRLEDAMRLDAYYCKEEEKAKERG